MTQGFDAHRGRIEVLQLVLKIGERRERFFELICRAEEFEALRQSVAEEFAISDDAATMLLDLPSRQWATWMLHRREDELQKLLSRARTSSDSGAQHKGDVETVRDGQ